MDASTLHNLIAGFGAGSASSLITCPLDVTKTRLQNQSLEHRHYSGTFRTLRIIYAEEGIRGLYRGLGATMLGYQPAWAIYFTTYHKFKIVFARNLRLPADNSNVHILSAMCAGALANASTNPFWVIKTRLITQSSQSAFHYRSILHAFSTIYHEEGIKGFYRGLGASLLGVGHVMIQFPVYEKAKKKLLEIQLKNNPNEKQLGIGYLILASVSSKVAAGIGAYPHEVLRTRLQNQTPTTVRYKGLIDCFKKIIQEEGVSALYRGLGTNLVRITPSGAITLLTYELTMRVLEESQPFSSTWLSKMH